MTINDVCDELAAVLEPDPALRDDSRARPDEVLADRLYLWPARDAIRRGGTRGAAALMEHTARLALAWAADRRAEADQPDRVVSDAVAGRLATYEQRLRAARQSGATYNDAHISEVDYQSALVTSPDARGFLATLTVEFGVAV